MVSPTVGAPKVVPRWAAAVTASACVSGGASAVRGGAAAGRGGTGRVPRTGRPGPVAWPAAAAGFIAADLFIFHAFDADIYRIVTIFCCVPLAGNLVAFAAGGLQPSKAANGRCTSGNGVVKGGECEFGM